MTSGLALLSFLLVALLVAGAMLVGAKILAVKSRQSNALRLQTYECGEVPSGPAWVRFHARYYVVALFFVLFDVETAFLLPWATIVRELGRPGLLAVGSFVVVLMLGWVWATKKGALEWQ
jgi:NADH-quinone oxidoreductase subunit A